MCVHVHVINEPKYYYSYPGIFLRAYMLQAIQFLMIDLLATASTPFLS